MWFAALGENYTSSTWFIQFSQRLLEGSKDVVNLLENNPFEGLPPVYVRATLYEYTFTTPEERRKTGQWWNRKFLGLYCPPVKLKGI